MKAKLILLIMTLSLIMSVFSGCGAAAQPANTPTSAPEPTDTAPESTGNTEQAPAGAPISQIIIGTTGVIETATRGEYNYDMLSSSTSELPLVYQDTEGAFHPLLAEFATEDSQTWTYTIRDGMTWSDGVAVTAEDILFTLEYEDANGSANLISQTDSDGKVTAAKYTGFTLSEDGRSISLTLAAANVRELSNMTSFRVMPKHIYEGTDTATDEQARIGCGPYAFSAFQKEAGTITFTVNPYYPETPNVGTVIFQLFGNEDTMYMALQNGDIDMVWNYSTGVSAVYQDVLAASEGVALLNVPAANLPAVLAFNNAKGPFAEEALRQAVACALDYEAFKLYFGSAYAQTPARGFVPPSTIGYTQTGPLASDPEAAAKHMADAGYTEKNAEGFYIDADGNALSFSLTVNGGKEAHVSCAELIKTQLEAFGIGVVLDILDSASYNAKTSNKFSENNITMEAAIYGFTAAGMGMKNGLASIYVDGTHPVQGGCQVYDETFQNILSKMSAAVRLEEYCSGAAKLQDYYAAHTPLIALYWDNMMYAFSSRLENITADYTFGLNNAVNWFTITQHG